MWSFNTRTGELRRDGVLQGCGYSGHGEGKLNPELDWEPSVGPIPRGLWRAVRLIVPMTPHGPYVLVLAPAEGTETHGRDGFLCHGDSVEHPGEASLGCIILSRALRELIWTSGDHDITVEA